MKLSKEGVDRIADEIVSYCEPENGEPVLDMTKLENCQFKQSDFEGVVVLSIDEAHTIRNSLFGECYDQDLLTERQKAIVLLWERLVEAGGWYESTEA